MLFLDRFLLLGDAWRVLEENCGWSASERTLAEIDWHVLGVRVCRVKLIVLFLVLDQFINDSSDWAVLWEDFQLAWRSGIGMIRSHLVLAHRIILFKAAFLWHRAESRVQTFDACEDTWALVKLSDKVLLWTAIWELDWAFTRWVLHIAALLLLDYLWWGAVAKGCLDGRVLHLLRVDHRRILGSASNFEL